MLIAVEIKDWNQVKLVRGHRRLQWSINIRWRAAYCKEKGRQLPSVSSNVKCCFTTDLLNSVV